MLIVFYGMSGSLKQTTINSDRFSNNIKIYSDIKSYYEYYENLFKKKVPINDLSFAVQRLLLLKNKTIINICKYHNTCIERGITDYLQCYNERSENSLNKLDENIISDIISEESNCLKNLVTSDKEIKKVLLVMKDEKFIEKNVLLETTRKKVYPDLKTYLEKQEKYVKFTEKWNLIDKTIEIFDAFEYIKSLKK